MYFNEFDLKFNNGDTRIQSLNIDLNELFENKDQFSMIKSIMYNQEVLINKICNDRGFPLLKDDQKFYIDDELILS